ncbi:MAG: AsmA family protein [Oxalobacter sp.]|nr:MAG: AsmA family protein [Oxalobacter sp.]
MRTLKWVLGLVVVLLVSLVVYLTVFFDLNNFKPEIVSAVKKQTGRDLVISKKLSWKFFPRLGINLGGITLSNPEGFVPAEMLQVDQVVVDVALMPLFSKKIEVVSLKLDGLILNLVTKKNGQSSLSGLLADADASEKSKTSASTKMDIAGLKIGGIAITNSQINMINEAKGERQQFNLDRLVLGSLSQDQFATFDFKVRAAVPDMTLVSDGKGQLKVASNMKSIKVKELKVQNLIEGKKIPNNKIQINLAAQMDVSLDKKKLQLQIDELTADATKATGKIDLAYGAAIPVIVANINLGDVDVDAFIPQKAAKKDQPTTAATHAAKEAEPDLTALKKLDLTLSMTAKSIKFANIHTQNWLMESSIKNGMLDLKKLTAQLYQGRISATAQLDARQKIATYRFSKNIEAVQLRPLLKDAANVDLLSGTAKFTVSGSGKSLITEEIKRNLLAKGNFVVADGALYGVNIPHMIRTAQATLQGKVAEKETAEMKTDFTSLTGSFTTANGLARNPDLLMTSPLIRLRGAGSAHLITNALDYKLTAIVVASLKGQGAEQTKQGGIEVPLTITGTMQKPKFGLDTSALLDARLKKEKEKVKEKVKKKLQEKLFKKLGRY